MFGGEFDDERTKRQVRGGPNRRTDGRAELVAKARAEREQREQHRHLATLAVKIQAWCRGRATAKKACAEQRVDWDRKMADIAKLAGILNKDVVAPLPTLNQLLRQLLFFYQPKRDTKRLGTLCTTVLLPSARSAGGGFAAVAAGTQASGGGVAERLRTQQLLAACLEASAYEDPDASAGCRLFLLHILGCRVEGEIVEEEGGSLNEEVIRWSRKSLLALGAPASLRAALAQLTGGPGYGGGATSIAGRRDKEAVAAGHVWAAACRLVGPTTSEQKRSPAAGRSAAVLEVEGGARAFAAQLLSLPALAARLGNEGGDRLWGPLGAVWAPALRAIVLAREPQNAGLDLPAPPPAGGGGYTPALALLGNLAELTGDQRAAELAPISLMTQATAATALLANEEGFESETNEENGEEEKKKGGKGEGRPPPAGALAMALSDRGAVVWRRGGGARGGRTLAADPVPDGLRRQLALLAGEGRQRGLARALLRGVDPRALAGPTAEEEAQARRTLEAAAAELAREAMRAPRPGLFGGLGPLRKLVAGGGAGLAQSFRAKLGMFGGKRKNPVSSSEERKNQEEEKSGLINTSDISRAIAAGGAGQAGQAAEQQQQQQRGPGGPKAEMTYDPDAVIAACELWAALLCALEAHPGNSHLGALLNALAFGTPLVARAWAFLVHEGHERALPHLEIGRAEPRGVHAVAAVFLRVYQHLLVVLDDAEIYEEGKPFPLHQIARVVNAFKEPCFRHLWEGGEAAAAAAPGGFPRFLEGACVGLLGALHARSARRPLCPHEAWLVGAARRGRVLDVCRRGAEGDPRARRLLARMPWALPFQDRMRLFEHFLRAERARHQPEGVRGTVVRIRRGYELEDGLRNLGRLGERIKERVVVVFVNAAGQDEPGIDMGGLFKEFWTELSRQSFNPEFGLFRLTDTQMMYPSPLSGAIHGQDHIALFEFLGRILGKALFEGITVQTVFSHFFLGFMRGNYNFLNLFNDLLTLDPELHKNLMFLKNYEGDAADLCLTFTVTEDRMGEQVEVELVPGGARLAVADHNKHRYVHAVAKRHLYDAIRPQAEAFTRGLWEAVGPGHLRMFSEPELQLLVSGGAGGVDLEDLRRHTRYTGGYTGLDPAVRRFWRVLGQLSDRERGALLRFVTSCERPPPLGFEALQPPFTVHRVGVRRDDEKLPSASTCFNTLKLPTYSSERALREKLLLAINSGAGFEMS